MDNVIHSRAVVQALYFVLIITICFLLDKINDIEIYNAITAFIVVDISNTERATIENLEKYHFGNSISALSQALIIGFIAPLFYITLVGNDAGIFYCLFSNLAIAGSYKQFSFFVKILNIIPSIIAQFFLYFIYVIRNKKWRMDFKGDYKYNCVLNPTLNVDIMAANIQKVNFNFYYADNFNSYIKRYGDFKSKIDRNCIKDYLGIVYGSCMVCFTLFFIINYLK